MRGSIRRSTYDPESAQGRDVTPAPRLERSAAPPHAANTVVALDSRSVRGLSAKRDDRPADRLVDEGRDDLAKQVRTPISIHERHPTELAEFRRDCEWGSPERDRARNDRRGARRGFRNVALFLNTSGCRTIACGVCVVETMLRIPDSSIDLPARAVESRQTRDATAWQGHPLTVEIYGAVEVVRMADRRRRADIRGNRPGEPRSLLGDWFALATQTLEPRQFARTHSVPARGNEADATLTHYAVWKLPPGAILNVGRCAPKFYMPGLGLQVEVVDLPSLPVLVRSGHT